MRIPWTWAVSVMLVASMAGATLGPGHAAGAEPIKVLWIEPTSGAFKYIGDGYRLGVTFAVKEINESGGINGRPIKLFAEDSQLNPDVARRKATQAILRDGVKIIIAGTGSHVVKALAQLAQEHNVILALYGGQADEITGAEFVPNVFRVTLNSSMHTAATLLGFVDKPYRKFFLLNQDYAMGRAVGKAYRKNLEPLIPDAQVVGEEYHPLATKDFAPYIQKIMASGAEVVLTGNWGSDLSILLKQALGFGLKIPFGHLFLSDPIAMREIGDAAIGHITSEHYMAGVNHPRNQAFLERWRKWNKDPEYAWPEYYTAGAYQTTMFLAAALRKAGREDADAVIKAWEGLVFEDSLVGPQVMRACDHQLQTPVAVAEIVPGPGKFYQFAYTGPVRLIPMEKISVPPKETGNKRCEKLP